MGCNSIPPSRTSSQGPEVCGPVGRSPWKWAYSKNSWMTRPKGIKARGYGNESQQPSKTTIPFTPAQSHKALNVAIMPINANVPMDVEIEDPIADAMAAAQEQLHLAMEAQAQDL